MLGESISDPECFENWRNNYRNAIAFRKHNFHQSERTENQVSGKFQSNFRIFWEFLSGAEFSGYEIHLGRTEQPENSLTTCGGAYSENIAGCYVHGIFDNADVSGRIIKKLYARRGVVYHGQVTDRRTYKEQQFDLLADTVRRSLDMNRIYQILQEGL